MFDSDMRTQIAATAKTLNVLPAALLAVAEVESGGRIGAKVRGRIEPMIRFEGHYFYRLLPKSLRPIAREQGLADPRAGRIVNPRHQARRWARLEKAIKLNRIAALSSVSWGVGQVMGSHWRWLGYGSVDALVQEARSGLSGQVRLMARFIQKSGLVDKLNRQDWAGFARRYNGPAYRKNRYDDKMAAAFVRYKNSEASGTEIDQEDLDEEIFRKKPLLKLRSRGRGVRLLQRVLSKQIAPLVVDGYFGKNTKIVVKKLQKQKLLIEDGVVGVKTWRQLKVIFRGTEPAATAVSPGPINAVIGYFRRLFNL